ncbi:MAG: MFS transporter [Coriobacteriales bacterium]|jgi:EmrB/QacA subfamily drug resistance transporter|nr:MFS transporter [Coriobacteriales bacterium]
MTAAALSKSPLTTNKWLALATTSVGTLMSTLNNSIVNIANPIMAESFQVSMAQVQWVSTIYLIVTSSMMLLFGRLGDRVGSHRVYIAGIAIFTAGSLSCALFDSFGPLLIARAVQAIGASMAVAVGMGLVATIFPISQRGRAMGITVLMVGLGNVTGPAVGGLVLAVASWHYIFLLSVPLGLVTFIMAALWLRSPLPRNREISLGLGSSVVFAGAIASLIVFMSASFEGHLWFGLVFLIFLAILVLGERYQKHPLLPPALLRNRRFIIGNLLALMAYCAFMMLVFQLPFFLNTVWAIPVGTMGVLMTVSSLTLAVCGPVSGFVADRFGASKVMLPALFVLFAGICLAFFLSADLSFGLFIAIMVLGGAGMGFFNTPNNSDIMTAAGREYSSFASGFVGTNRNLGFCIGTALSAGVFSLGTADTLGFLAMPVKGTGATLISEHLFSFSLVICMCLLIVSVCIVLCLYLLSTTKTQKTTPEQLLDAQPKS